ncbi:Na+/H+ antiporter family protein [Stieleria maiorica]|uniref:Na+/H+ antiporter family protein n=1 Tax=Stieleria maiorica TaxID=2795974 RepID=A0A5B9MLN5_9BACT|nr:Na+/H+ antiporter family protein [Stieleria maiorica]
MTPDAIRYIDATRSGQSAIAQSRPAGTLSGNPIRWTGFRPALLHADFDSASPLNDHPYGWLSLLPPLVAIVLAMVTKRAALSLLVGIFCGTLITTGGDPIAAVVDFCEVHLWPTLADPGKLRIFAFTLLMGAMIGVISRSGGMLGLIKLITPIAKTRRGGQLTTWLLGMVVFFDDYSNTVLLGGTLRPLCDRLKISRQKLAYIVDSTAAPMASLALLSTWIAVEIDYIAEGLGDIEGAEVSRAMELFIASIPYRFYAILALVMVPMLALTRRDFGPMLRAEHETIEAGSDGRSSHEGASADPLTEPAAETSWLVAVVPIAATLAVVIGLLYATGIASLQSGESDSLGEAPRLRDILGAADSSLALQYGALTGLATIALICLARRLLTLQQIREASWGGMKIVLPAIVILWTASALSRLTGGKSVEGQTGEQFEFQDHRLYTGQFVAETILSGASVSSTGDADSAASGSVPLVVRLLPTIVFLLAAALSFSTGTSFGTMGLLMPMTLTLTAPLVAALPGDVASSPDVLTHPLMLATIASVLSGAVFGDHCSPISDTTILSSQACGCDHMEHVLTQMPYAVTAGLIAMVAGTLPIGWGIGWGWLLLIQVGLLAAVVAILGRRIAAGEAIG